MDRELNLDFIRALEEQIEEEEHERAIIQLKRSRNSLLNVSTLLPPEILGIIFLWNATPMGDFGGLSKGSYNFLLVCHHWFEVASRTPELWGFWGNSVEDWTHRHTRCRTAPLDLVLAGYTVTVWMIGSTPRCRIVPHGIPYDGPTSVVPAQNFSAMSSPQYQWSLRVRKLGQTAWSRS